MKEKDNDWFKLIIAIVVLIAIVGLIIFINYRNAKKEAEISQETVIVTNPSRYYTVVGCVKKFLNYVQMGNKSNLLLLLNDEYKEEKQITEANIDLYLPQFTNEYTYDYVSDEMYQKRISKNVTEYYVKGKIQKSQLYEDDIYEDYDLTVILYENEFLFSIKPGVTK